MRKQTLKTIAKGAGIGTLFLPPLGTVVGGLIGAGYAAWQALPEDLSLKRRKEPRQPGLIARTLKERQERIEAEAARKRREEEERNRPTPEQIRQRKIKEAQDRYRHQEEYWTNANVDPRLKREKLFEAQEQLEEEMSRLLM